MGDFRDAKVMARTLRDVLKAKAIEITHTEALELIAKAFGYKNWNMGWFGRGKLGIRHRCLRQLGVQAAERVLISPAGRLRGPVKRLSVARYRRGIDIGQRALSWDKSRSFNGLRVFDFHRGQKLIVRPRRDFLGCKTGLSHCAESQLQESKC